LNFFCQALGGWFRPARNMIAGFQALSGKHRVVRLTGTGLVRQNTHRQSINAPTLRSTLSDATRSKSKPIKKSMQASS